MVKLKVLYKLNLSVIVGQFDDTCTPMPPQICSTKISSKSIRFLQGVGIMESHGTVISYSRNPTLNKFPAKIYICSISRQLVTLYRQQTTKKKIKYRGYKKATKYRGDKKRKRYRGDKKGTIHRTDKNTKTYIEETKLGKDREKITIQEHKYETRMKNYGRKDNKAT